MKKRFFITFEGSEGSGKSTQIKRLAADLKKRGYRVLVLREPGGTRISEAIRRILLDRKFKVMSPKAELLLYLAARAQVVFEKIVTALQRGEVVICDRFEDSTLAYQGFGRKISFKIIDTLSRFVRGPLRPDLTIVLDIDAKQGMKRGGRKDRIERESYAFHGRVRRGFLKLARKDPKRFMILDALADKEIIARKILERVHCELR
jgi:dTMP kinase